jgi:ATP-dependent helicase HrpB
MMSDALPIDEVLGDVVSALQAHGRVVLQAPPGAGKTSRVPLALLHAGFAGQIVMLEPRRLAVRAAAERLAQQLGEDVGGRVGYRMRGESSVGPGCRILVVTEGILTRMVQTDPELRGVGTVILMNSTNGPCTQTLALPLSGKREGPCGPIWRL